MIFVGGGNISTMENHSEAFLKVLNVNVVETFNVTREVALTMIKNTP